MKLNTLKTAETKNGSYGNYNFIHLAVVGFQVFQIINELEKQLISNRAEPH